MNQSELSYYSDLKAKAVAELNLATYARNLERVDMLTKRITEYQAKIDLHIEDIAWDARKD